MVADATKTIKLAGSDTNPSGRARNVYGSTTATITTAQVVAAKARLGRLLKGLCIVRITNRTSVCVASDSTNQPVWKNASLA